MTAAKSKPAKPARPDTVERKHLTPGESARLIDAAGKAGRNGVRDRALVMVAYYHGLRASEAVGLEWQDIDWTTESIHIARLKHGLAGTHPLQGVELRALRALHKERDRPTSGHMFVSERGEPLSVDMFARIVQRAGMAAGIGLHVHPHMLRHACGFYLANKGTDTRTIQAYLGHSQISSTVIYTQLSSTRFRGLFKD